MSTVDLCAVWLNLASDLSDGVAFERVSQLNYTPSQDVSFRTLANGRERLVRRAGKRQTASFQANYLTREQVAWLEAHAGELMVYRDHLGRKFYGTYLSPQVAEGAYDTEEYGDVPIAFREITHSEVV